MKNAQLSEKKGSVTEEIEKLKQRREERKNKKLEDKKIKIKRIIIMEKLRMLITKIL